MLALSIGLWLVYFLACIGFGSLLRRLLAFKIAGVNRASSWVELATVFLLGPGLLANIWLLLLLGSDRAAKLLVWSNSLVVAIMLLAICARVGLRRRGQLIASAILFTSIAFILIIPDGKVDLFAAAMGMGAFYWALRVREEGGTAAL